MEQIKNIKLNKKIIFVIAVIGILLMVFGGSNGKEKDVELSDETRLERTLSQIEGVGNTSVMLSVHEDNSGGFYQQKGTTKYIGAVILAEGGAKSGVKEKIIKAVSVITGLDAHRIVVYRLDK